jgi:O-antigen ligase
MTYLTDSLQIGVLKILTGLIVVLISAYLAFTLTPLDKMNIIWLLISLIAPFLVIALMASEKTWVPILILLLPLRDLNLAGLVGSGGLKIGDIFISLIFIIWLFRDLFMKRSTQVVKTKLDLSIVLFLILYAISLFWATDLEQGVWRVSKLFRDFFLFIIIRDLLIKDFLGNYKKMTISYIVTGVVIIIVYSSVIYAAGGFSDYMSLYEKETISSIDMRGLRTRGTGGGFLISGISDWLMVAGSLVYGTLALTKSAKASLIKIFIIVLMFAMATIGTLSRSAFIMGVIIISVLFLGNIKIGLRKLKKNILMLLVVIIILGILGAGLGAKKIYTGRFSSGFEDQSWLERLVLYEVAIKAFFYSPIYGIGPGSNITWQDKHIEMQPSRIVHSTYLTILSELGLIGLIIFTIMLYYWLSYLWHCLRSPDVNIYFRNISLAIFAFSIGYLILAAIQQEFEAFEPWLMMAFASALENLYSSGVCTVNNIASKKLSQSSQRVTH